MRIVALSDLHGHLPEIPPCDLLIVAGDVCPDRVGGVLAKHEPYRQKVWFDAHVRPWLASAPAHHKILTWGNHDWCGQACSFDADLPPDAPSTRLQILVDSHTHVLTSREPSRRVSLWGTPWSNEFMHWAFMKPRADLADVYSAIPEGIDILISHQPPYGLGDRHVDARSGEVEHLGSHELKMAMDRVKPRLVICGHMHDGHGVYDHGSVAIYNVSLVNDQYRVVRGPTVIDIEDW